MITTPLYLYPSSIYNSLHQRGDGREGVWYRDGVTQFKEFHYTKDYHRDYRGRTIVHGALWASCPYGSRHQQLGLTAEYSFANPSMSIVDVFTYSLLKLTTDSYSPPMNMHAQQTIHNNYHRPEVTKRLPYPVTEYNNDRAAQMLPYPINNNISYPSNPHRY